MEKYFDKNDVELYDGCFARFPDGSIERIYLTSDGGYGTDATNPEWIKAGLAEPLDYGIYPLTVQEIQEIEVL